MNQVEQILPASSRRVVELSPFDYFPTRRSVLGGLGGTDNLSDPTYAFHTSYQACAAGPITFTVRLRDLVATDGNLILRVHVAPRDFSADAKLARTAQIALPMLQARGGEVSLQVQARRGMVYALLGYVHGEAEVPVSACTITLDRLDHSETDADSYVEAEESRFGAAATKPVGMLIAEDAPTIAAPVSQAETAGQHREKHFRRWAAEFAGADAEALWPTIYIARVLEAYGMIGEGARGLGLGGGDARLDHALASRGCQVARNDPSAGAGDEGGGTADDSDEPQDFIFSIGVCDRLGSISEATDWMTRSLDRLRVGGLAIHCFRFRAAPEGGGGAPGALVLSRADVERFAFSLIANNHETAQVSYGDFVFGPPFPETWFGFVVRKGTF